MTDTTSKDRHAANHLLAIGSRLRMARQSRGLTLQDLARETGLSSSMISLVERGRASPSIGSLVAMSSALGIHIRELFDEENGSGSSPVSRAVDQVVIQPDVGVERTIVKTDNENNVEISLNNYEPGSAREPESARHHGYEYGIVLAGELTVELAGTKYVLGEGDAIAYDSSQLHSLYNEGKKRVRALWVNLRAF